MKHLLSAALAATLFAAAACGVDPQSTDTVSTSTDALQSPTDLHGKPEPDMLGVVHERGAAKPVGGGSSPQLTWHSGPVMHSVTIQPIFWGTSWSNASFTQDKVTGLEQLYHGYAGSGYARTNGEYTDGSGFVTSTNITVQPSLFDSSAAPSRAPKTAAILAEACKMIGANVRPDGYYPIYTDTPRGSAAYCAWHSWGVCGTTNVQFAFFFKLDGDTGCDPADTTSGRSQGLSALASVSGHELSEFVTDPRGNGWTDSGGSENADKCAWVFSEPVILADGSSWKIQGNWSNAAYTAGTGFANSSGQKACLYNAP